MALEYGVKMTWDEYVSWADWDAFPERIHNPPYTVEVAFRYKDRCYFIDHCTIDNDKHIGEFILYDITDDEHDVEIARFDNYLKLVAHPCFDGKSFRDRITEFEFAY